MKHKKIAVILSGSGVFDGSEIHETVATLLAIDRAGLKNQCFAPDKDQYHVINHITGEEMPEKRNILVESARISRGNVLPITDFDAADFDALILPGGFGAAKNLSTFAFEGTECTIDPEVERVVLAMHKAKKPIGAICISPVLISKIIQGATVTIGTDKETAAAIETFGGKHESCLGSEILVDHDNKLVTSACYMLNSSISVVAQGAENTVLELMKMMK